MLTATEIIDRIDKVYLSRPERWTKGYLARDAEGQACEPRDEGACRWCLLGAFHAVTGGAYSPVHDAGATLAWRAIYDAVLLSTPSPNQASVFNDLPSTRFVDIKNVLAKAKSILDGKS